MNVWNQAPLVRLILPLILGILTAVNFPYQHKMLLIIALILFVFISSFVLIPKINVYRKSHWFGVLIHFALFIFGYQLTIFHTAKFSPSHFSGVLSKNDIVYGHIVNTPIEKENSIKATVEITEIKNAGKWEQCKGKSIIYLKKDSAALTLKYGDDLLLNTNFYEIKPPQNPGEFDYKKYLSHHNIYHQAFVDNLNWKKSGVNSGNSILNYSLILRFKLLNILKSNDLKEDELSVGSALLLGYMDTLDAELLSAYANSGTLHILSVSGLHVAIVYIVFSWLLSFLDKYKKGTLLKAALLILFLWFYAALTGLSPSVLRASTMLSFIVIANAFNRQTNIYNTLAASVFLLLLINPYLLMDVGFQLSYLAVIGIVYLQPKIYNWVEFDNRILDQIWKITAVSIAAQISTFPLGFYYFHQFPNYFLLSNLLVIPLSTAIIYIGIAMFSVTSFPFLVKYFAILFEKLIWLLNAIVKWIESLPFSILQGVSISAFETLLIYGGIVLFLLYLNKPKFNYLVCTFSICIIFLISQTVEQHFQHNQQKIIIYNVPKTIAIDFIQSHSNVLYLDSPLKENKRALGFYIKQNWWELGINDSEIISANYKSKKLKIEENFVQFFDKRLFILNRKIALSKIKIQPIRLDYLIVSNNIDMNVAQMKKLFQIKKIIFDASNSKYRIDQWKKECSLLHQEYNSILDSGAIEIFL